MLGSSINIYLGTAASKLYLSIFTNYIYNVFIYAWPLYFLVHTDLGVSIHRPGYMLHQASFRQLAHNAATSVWSMEC